MRFNLSKSYLIDGTGKAWALQINPIVPFMAKRKDIVVTDSVWNDGAFAPSGSKWRNT